MPHISEYEVETKFIDRLESIGYEYIELKNYDDVLDNFKTQLIKFNEPKIIEAKGSVSLSDLMNKRRFQTSLWKLITLSPFISESAKNIRS